MAIDAEWEKFHGGPTVSTHDRLHVTINPGGKILLNDRSYRELGKPEAVYLYYNRQRERIALQPTSPRLPGAFPVRARQRRGYHVYAAPFCTHFGIKIDATHRFTRPEIADGRLILNLAETVVVTRLRNKTRTRPGER